MTRTAKGVLWILGPWIVLGILLIGWAIQSAVVGNALANGAGVSMLGTVRILNTMFGAVGILSVIMAPIGLIIGIVILATKPKAQPNSNQ